MRRIGVVAVSVAIGICTACGASGLVSADPFARPHEVVKSWWSADESAFIAGDQTLLEALYAGSALETARGQMTAQALRKSKPVFARPYRGSTIFLTATGGSTWFLAIVAFAPVDVDGRAHEITQTFPGVLFGDVGGKWKAIAADVQAPIPHGLASGDQMLASPPADDQFIAARSSVAGAYADYLNSRVTGAPISAPFPTGPTSVAAELAGLRWPPGSIATAQFTFSVESADLATYATTTGVTQVPEVQLFVLRRIVLVKPRRGCLLRNAADIEWSDIVPPGSYSSITLTTLAVVAASVPLNNGDTSQGRKIIDISAGIDDVAATGVKC